MAEESAGSKDQPARPSNAPRILALVNSIAVLAAAGLLFYTRVLYKRPVITETTERDRLADLRASPLPAPVSTVVTFDSITVNIASNPMHPSPADGTSRQLEGKLHYATIAFALELRDSNRKDEIEEVRPLIMDRLLSLLGRKSFQEVTTVEGRYVLRTKILEISNSLVNQRNPQAAKENLVTNAYFTNFIVQ